jgi:Fe-S oxidoreductase
VFYFPGCGSERLFSQVGLATQAMLWHAGATTVLPPGYLCCGYPQTASGDEDKGQAITTANRVLFHRVANTLNYLDIKTVVVSCGTCMDQLLKYEFGKIFPGCRLVDIHEWLFEKGIKLDGVKGTQYMYHEPCHTPMKHHSGIKVANASDGPARRPQRPLLRRIRLAGGVAARHLDPDPLPQAAGDRGGRAACVRRKSRRWRDGGEILTSCPSCLQGLSRYENDADISADYIVVEMAKAILGPDWMQDYLRAANGGGIERVLL